MVPEQEVQPPACDLPRAGYSLWCAVCGQMIFSGIENLETYSRLGWPRCCGEIMYCGPTNALGVQPTATR
jgi:hypothetical protein